MSATPSPDGVADITRLGDAKRVDMVDTRDMTTTRKKETTKAQLIELLDNVTSQMESTTMTWADLMKQTVETFDITTRNKKWISEYQTTVHNQYYYGGRDPRWVVMDAALRHGRALL